MVQKYIRKILALITILFLLITIFPGGNFKVSAATTTFYLDKGDVKIENNTGKGYDSDGNYFEVTGKSIYTITETSPNAKTNHCIQIYDSCQVIVQDLNIDMGTSSDDAMLINTGNVKLYSVGKNTFKGGSGNNKYKISGAGIHVISHSASLTLSGDGEVEAIGGDGGGAGIGGSGGQSDELGIQGYFFTMGDINIVSGYIIAVGGSAKDGKTGGAGIGCGGTTQINGNDSSGTINISGGFIQATGKDGAMSIGDSLNTSAPYLNISGGSIYAPNGIKGLYGAKVSGGQICTLLTLGDASGNIKNNNGEQLCQTSITLPKTSNDLVDKLSVTMNGNVYSYGSKDIYTDVDPNNKNKLCLYFPFSENVQVNLTIQGKSYNYYGNVRDNGVVLKMDNIAPVEIQNMHSSYNAGELKAVPISPKIVCSGTEIIPSSSMYTGREGTIYNSGTAPTHVGKYKYTATVKNGDDIYYDSKVSYDFEITTASFKIDNIPDQAYTGSEIKPGIVVKTQDGKILTENTDYKVSYNSNTNIGDASVNVTGINAYADYTGSAVFKIVASSGWQVSSIPDQPYTGSAIEPIVATCNGVTLVKGTDYNVLYSNNINVGEAGYTVTGIGNYSGVKTGSFKIVQSTDLKLDSIPDQVYTGSAIEPEVKVETSNGRVLVKGTDYNITYDNNVNAGKAGCTITGIGNYSGVKTGNFEINPSTDLKIDNISDQVYTGSAIEPDVKVETSNGRVLVKGTDYNIIYDNNTNAGTGNVKAAGVGNYTGTVSASFKINPSTHFSVSDISNQVYTGNEIKPDVNVTDGDKVLVKDTDYTVTYSNNTNAGMAAAEITGKGNYTGTKTVNFVIEAIPVITVTGNPSSWAKGAKLIPSVTAGISGLKSLKVNGIDITGTYKDGYAVTKNGDYTFTATSNSGITSFYTEHVTMIDTVKPDITLPGDNTAWSSSNISVLVAVNDDLSGVKSVTYTTDEAENKQTGTVNLTSGTGSIVLTHEGSYNVIVTAVDNAGNEASSKTLVKIDKTAPQNPQITVSGNTFKKFLNTITFGMFFKDSVDVSISADDAQSGIKSIQYQKVSNQSDYNENGTWTDYNGGFSVSPDDKFIIYAKITDSAGNYVIINTDGIVVDKTGPGVELTVPDGWQTKDVIVLQNVWDTLSGIKSISYKTDEAVPQTGTTIPIILSNEGQYNLTVTAEDNSGNVTTKTVGIKIDKTKPSINVTGNPTSPVQSAVLNIAESAGPSGIKSVTVSKDGGKEQPVSGSQYTINENGTYVFAITNNAGVKTQADSVVVNEIDTSKPVLNINTNGYTSGTWSNNDVRIDVSNDNSKNIGTTNYEYSLDGGSKWIAFSGSLNVQDEGIKNYTFRAVSESGVISDAKDITVKIDKTAPQNPQITVSGNAFKKFLNTITFGMFFKDSVDVSISADDAASGIKSIQYQKVSRQSDYNENGTWTDYAGGFSVSPDDKFIIYAKITDNAGNYVIINTDGVIVDKTSPNLQLIVPNGWQSGNVTVNVDAEDSLSGLKNVSYTTDETIPQSGTVEIVNGKGSITLSNEGQYNLNVTAADNSGNVIVQTAHIMLDKTNPTIAVSGTPSIWTNKDVNLVLKTTTGISGIRNITVNGSDITKIYKNGFTVSQNGTYEFDVTNGAGVTGKQTVTVDNIDKTVPTIQVTGNAENWTNKDIKLKVDASSGASGIKSVTVNGSDITGTYKDGFTVSQNGTYEFDVTNGSGVTDKQIVTVDKVDKTAPSDIAISFTKNPVKSVANFITFGMFFKDTVNVSASAKDLESGIDHYEYQAVPENNTFNANDTWTKKTFSIEPDFKGSIYARAVDLAGNVSEYVVKSLVTDNTKPVINVDESTLQQQGSIIVKFTDNCSGIGSVSYSIENDNVKTVDFTGVDYNKLTKQYTFTIENLSYGKYDVVINASDNSGNAADSCVVHVDRKTPLPPQNGSSGENPIPAPNRNVSSQATPVPVNNSLPDIAPVSQGNSSTNGGETDTETSNGRDTNAAVPFSDNNTSVEFAKVVDGKTVSQIVTDTKTNVVCDLKEAELPKGVEKVSVEAVALSEEGTESTVYKKVGNFTLGDSASDKLKGLKIYDIKLLDQNGRPVTGFQGKVKVKIPIPEGLSGDLHVFWYDDKNNKLIDMNAKAEDGYLVFETTHFSYYAIASKIHKNKSAMQPASIWGISILIFAGAATCGALIICRMKRRNS